MQGIDRSEGSHRDAFFGFGRFERLSWNRCAFRNQCALHEGCHFSYMASVLQSCTPAKTDGVAACNNLFRLQALTDTPTLIRMIHSKYRSGRDRLVGSLATLVSALRHHQGAHERGANARHRAVVAQLESLNHKVLAALGQIESEVEVIARELARQHEQCSRSHGRTHGIHRAPAFRRSRSSQRSGITSTKK